MEQDKDTPVALPNDKEAKADIFRERMRVSREKRAAQKAADIAAGIIPAKRASRSKELVAKIAESNKPYQADAGTGEPWSQEILFREAMIAIIQTMGAKTPQSVRSCIPAAEEYVAIIRKKFGK